MKFKINVSKMLKTTLKTMDGMIRNLNLTMHKRINQQVMSGVRLRKLFCKRFRVLYVLHKLRAEQI